MHFYELGLKTTGLIMREREHQEGYLMKLVVFERFQSRAAARPCFSAIFVSDCGSPENEFRAANRVCVFTKANFFSNSPSDTKRVCVIAIEMPISLSLFKNSYPRIERSLSIRRRFLHKCTRAWCTFATRLR